MQTGFLTEVVVAERRTSITAATAAGATSVPVEDLTDFDAGDNVRFGDDTTVYTITAVDEGTSTIAVDPVTTTALDESDGAYALAGDQIAVDTYGVVSVTDDETGGESVRIPIAFDQVGFSEGQYDPPLAVTVADDLSRIVDVDGVANPLPAAVAASTEAIDDLTPTDPPAESPAVRAFGDAGGITLITDSIDPTTILDVYVDGSPAVEPQAVGTRSTVIRLTKDETGAAFVDGTVYTFHVVARNVVGSAAPSADVSAQLNQGVSPEFVSAEIVAGFVLAGQITVGNITIDPDDGISIPLADGGLIQFPADGSGATVDADLATGKLVVRDKATIQGENNLLGGKLTIQSSWKAPTNAPTVSKWALGSASYLLSPASSNWGGIVDDSSTTWLVNDHTTPTVATRIWSVDKATGAATLLRTLTTTSDLVAKIGTSYYVRDYQALAVFDASWNKVASLTGNAALARGTDGTNLLAVVYGIIGGGNGIRVLDASTGALKATITVPSNSDFDNYGITAVAIGNFDYGALRLLASSGNKLYSFTIPANYATTNSTAVEQGAERATITNGDSVTSGIAYDSTTSSLWLIRDADSNSSRIFRLCSNRTSTSRSFTWTRYDNNGTTHESKPSPATVVTQAARQYLRVTTDALPASPDVDDPDSVRIYVGNQLQASGVTGQIGYLIDVPTSGAAAPTTEGFPVGSPKRIVSQDADGSGTPYTDIRGDGYLRAMKTLQSGSVNVTSSSASTASLAVTFAVPFDSTPVVVPGWQGNNSNWIVGVTAVSTTGFTAVITQKDGTALSATVPVGWIAMAKTQ